MSKKNRILDLPIKKVWFDKIKTGEKTHEYRKATSHWCNNIGISIHCLQFVDKLRKVDFVRFRAGQTVKSTDKDKVMYFEIKSIETINGKNTDLAIDCNVFDIKLGKRVYIK